MYLWNMFVFKPYVNKKLKVKDNYIQALPANPFKIHTYKARLL